VIDRLTAIAGALLLRLGFGVRRVLAPVPVLRAAPAIAARPGDWVPFRPLGLPGTWTPQTGGEP
jgi:hypothetical protein